MSVLNEACFNLIEIAKMTKKEDFFKMDASNLLPIERYDLNRLWRTVHGLQMVIWLNHGTVPHTWLPQLFDPQKYRGQKLS